MLEKLHGAVKLSSMADKLFLDGIVNWGRIVSLTAFGVSLHRLGKTSDSAEVIAEDLSEYLLSKHKAWLIENRSWVSLPYTSYRFYTFTTHGYSCVQCACNYESQGLQTLKEHLSRLSLTLVIGRFRGSIPYT